MKGLRKITPYIPGKQPTGNSLIKLNTNENPYPASPNVQDALAHFSTDALKRYNSIDNHSLKTALANVHGLTPEHYIIGNGSDELLAFCFLAFFNSNDPLLFPDLTYGFYKVWADLFRIPFKEIPLTEEFQIDFDAYTQPNGGIVIANPNAPTGKLEPLSKIRKLLETHSDVIVIIDEAYVDFAGVSAISLLADYPNLIIVRTFSKSTSLAGLRVGYAIGHPSYIQVVASIKFSFNPYSVDMIAEKLAVAAVEDTPYYETTIKKINETKSWFSKKLLSLGFTSLESSTNFLLVTHPTVLMSELYDFLILNNTYVRYFPDVPRLTSYLRITIGTQQEMEIVLSLIKQFVNASENDCFFS